MLAELYRKYMPMMVRIKVADLRMKRANIEALENIRAGRYLGFDKECEYMTNRGKVCTFPYEWSEKYKEENVHVEYDETCSMHYVIHRGKRLYFPKRYSSGYIRRLYNSLLIEQDLNSTHCYFNPDEVDMTGKSFFDIGAAEGIIALSIVEQVANLVLFEANADWGEALRQTFQPWSEKTRIVSCYAGEANADNMVTVDKIAQNYEHIVLKMDVEGMEMSVLHGCLETLERNDTEVHVCIYHHENDEDELKNFLIERGYVCLVNEGYIFYGEPLSFRHGVLHAVKK